MENYKKLVSQLCKDNGIALYDKMLKEEHHIIAMVQFVDTDTHQTKYCLRHVWKGGGDEVHYKEFYNALKEALKG